MNLAYIHDDPNHVLRFIGDDLTRHMAPEVSVEVIEQGSATHERLQPFDAVYAGYSWMAPGLVSTISTMARPRPNVLTGVHSHREVAGNPEHLHQHLDPCTRIHAVNDKLYRWLRPVHPQIQRLPAAVDADVFCPGNRTYRRGREIVVGWAGSLGNFDEHYRGVDLLREACEGLDGVELRVLSRFDNGLPRAKMADWYRDVDVYCCLSEAEGHPMTVLEAAACGCVILGADCGIVPEFMPVSIKTPWPGQRAFRNVGHVRQQIADLRELKTFRRMASRVARKRITEAWSWQAPQVRARWLAFLTGEGWE